MPKQLSKCEWDELRAYREHLKYHGEREGELSRRAAGTASSRWRELDRRAYDVRNAKALEFDQIEEDG